MNPSTTITREEAETLGQAPGYAAAVEIAARLMGEEALDCIEKAEIGLALAEEQLGNLPDTEAGPAALAGALATLEAAEDDLAGRDHWTSHEALPAREMMVRLLDRQASLLLAIGRPAAGFLKARLAQELAADFGEEHSDAEEDRAELMLACAEASGRDDFIREAHQMMDRLGLSLPMASAGSSMEEAMEAAPDEAFSEMSEASESLDGFESMPVTSAPAPESFPSAPAPETMRGPTPTARRRSRASRTASPAPAEDAPAPDASQLPYHEVPIFFATHRNRTGRKNPYDYFRGKRAPLSLGRALVTVPKMREVGEFKVAKRNSWKRADKAKLITIDTIDLIGDRDDFIGEIRGEISDSTRKEALVFIHGFNTSFAGALQRAGQLSVDLDIDGATLMYSWPSKGSLLSYVVDRNQVVFEFLDDLQKLIVDVALETGAQRVHLLAHSMGCQFLLDAVHAALLNPKVQALGDQPVADEIIFASPDVDAQNFTSKLSQAAGLARRITVYSSRQDRALRASQILQGGVRAGQAPDIVGAAGFDAVDTTAAEQDFLGHSDYSKSAIDDVRAVVWVPEDVSPAKRDAILKPDETRTYYIYRGDEVAETGIPFRRALLYLRENGSDAARAVFSAASGAAAAVGGLDDLVRGELRKLLT